jgi:hypothetical protein
MHTRDTEHERLPAPMRRAMYLACLLGAGHALEAMRIGPLAPDTAHKGFGDARHDLTRALNLLKMAQGEHRPDAAPLLHSEVETTAVAVVSMAADGLDPNRPTPHDWALEGSVKALYAYVATRSHLSPDAAK